MWLRVFLYKLLRSALELIVKYLLQANELLQFGEEEPDTVDQVNVQDIFYLYPMFL